MEYSYTVDVGNRVRHKYPIDTVHRLGHLQVQEARRQLRRFEQVDIGQDPVGFEERSCLGGLIIVGLVGAR